MAELVLGPLLRYVDERSATVWVETDRHCEVEVRGWHAGGGVAVWRETTFAVADHHYALVAVEGLAPGDDIAYAVALDGEPRWPPGADGDSEDATGWPDSRLRTIAGERGLRIAFGSCRVAAPHEHPWRLKRVQHREGRGMDALQALAHQLAGEDRAQWPSLLLMVGDQVYADDASPETRSFIRARRSIERPPGDDVADFEEYTRLYREAWSEPTTRWLLSTVPSAMIFDDHEVIDDWNISASWRAEMTAQPWWRERIAGALMSYWLYQHLGNLSPSELRTDPLLERVRGVGDGGEVLYEAALRADEDPDAIRWSFGRDLGAARLVVVDSRAARVVEDSRRAMLSRAEWRWLDGELCGDVDHLVVVTSLPFLLPRAIHDLEAWNEAVCAGVWGKTAARWGERLRRRVDLEHWAAFRGSFEQLAGSLREVVAGRRGRPPATVMLLSGDVHYAYLAEAELAGGHSDTVVVQAVCSPFRHGLSRPMELANRVSFSRVAEAIGAALTRFGRVPPPPLRWRTRCGPFFDNEVATLDLHGRQATVRLERTPPQELALETVDVTRLR